MNPQTMNLNDEAREFLGRRLQEYSETLNEAFILFGTCRSRSAKRTLLQLQAEINELLLDVVKNLPDPERFGVDAFDLFLEEVGR